MIKKLITTNVILYCKEFEKTIQFYRNRLNLSVNFSKEWFVEFNLTATSRLSIIDEKRASIKSCEGQGMTLALEVADIETEWEYMKTIGLEPSEIREHPWDARVFHLFDPEGHRIEIWQPSNQSKASKRNANQL